MEIVLLIFTHPARRICQSRRRSAAGTHSGAKKSPSSGSHCFQQRSGTEDVHDPLEVVGEHMQAHLGSARAAASWSGSGCTPSTTSTFRRDVPPSDGAGASSPVHGPGAACAASSTASCSQRVTRRSLPVVHRAFKAQLRASGTPVAMRSVLPALLTLRKRRIRRSPAGQR